jgi:hypothetical protein
MANTATLMVRILGDASNAQRTMGKFAGTMEKALVPAAAVGAALVAVGASAVKSASNLQQAQGAVDAVFGRSAKIVDNYAKTSADRLGVSASEYLNSAALMGTALQNAGFSSAEAAKTSDAAWSRASDMAALYGGTGAEAMDAINAAISRGEFEQIERYGVSLKQDAILSQLAAKGQGKLTGQAKKNAIAQETLAEIMKQSGLAAGQFGRESDTVAVQQQKLRAQVEDSKAAIGTGLLPIVAAAARELAKMADWAGKNTKTVGILAGVIAGLVGAVLAINGAIKVYRAWTIAADVATKLWNGSTLILRGRLLAISAGSGIKAAAAALASGAKSALLWAGAQVKAGAATVAATAKLVAQKAIQLAIAGATKAWAAAQWLLNVAMSANPIGLVVLAIIALIAIFVIAWKRSDKFRAVVVGAFEKLRSGVIGAAKAVWNWIKSNWPLLLAILLGPIAIAVALIVKNWAVIKRATVAAFSFVRSFIQRILGGIRTYFTIVFGIYRAIFSKAWSVIKSLTRGAFQAAKTFILNPMNAALAFIRSIPGKVSSGLANLKSNAKAKFSDAFEAAKAKGKEKLDAFVTFVKGIPGKAASALSDLGAKVKAKVTEIDLFKAGADLITGLTDGIQSKIESAVSAVRDGAKKIKDLWPGSPVKTGPLTAWNNGKAGRRLMAMLASGIEKGTAEVERAAELAAYGISGGLSIAATATGSPQVNVSVPDAGPTIVEVHLDGQIIGRYVQKRVNASIGAQARRIVLGAIS